MMDSAEKGKAYDQAIMPIQMVSQVPYFQREVRRALLPSITLKEVLDYRANLKTVGRPELMVIGNMTADAATTPPARSSSSWALTATNGAAIKTWW